MRVVDWPEGNWPPQIDAESGGVGALLVIDGRPQRLEFSLIRASEVDAALAVADEMLDRMGWVE